MEADDFRALMCRHCRRWRIEHGRKVRGFEYAALRCPVGTGFFESALDHQPGMDLGVSRTPRVNKIREALAETVRRNVFARGGGRA
jgi:hypothetical protein